MKQQLAIKFYKFPSLLFLSIFLSGSGLFAQSQNVNVFLKKVQSRLESIKQMSFEYSRELSYKSENYFNKSGGSIFLDFSKKDTTAGFWFQGISSPVKSIYNGSEVIHMNDRDTTIDIIYKARQTDISSYSVFYNSPVTFRYALKKLIEDPAIGKELRDTAINGVSYSCVQFSMKNSVLGNLGTISKLTITKTIYYLLIVGKDYLPAFVIQTADINPEDFTKTTFAKYNLKPAQPDEHSWYASTYQDKYRPKTERKLITVGVDGPKWNLPKTIEKGSLSLDSLKGNVVMLEFWFKNCGPCILAVPELNKLNSKYKDKAFKLVAINAEDTRENAMFFINKWKVEYTTVYNGHVTAANYGIISYPTTVILDKKGKVVYAGGTDIEKIEKVISESL